MQWPCVSTWNHVASNVLRSDTPLDPESLCSSVDLATHDLDRDGSQRKPLLPQATIIVSRHKKFYIVQKKYIKTLLYFQRGYLDELG
jgi:hypothetical protein